MGTEETFNGIKEKCESIALVNLLEKVCYSYKAHEYTLLGVLDALDKLTVMRQADDDVNGDKSPSQQRNKLC